MNIYVGNLSHDAVEEDLRTAFGNFGAVSSAIIIRDKVSGAPRGFAFVKMDSETEGQAAIAGLNGKELQGRPLNVNVARARE
jgi:RNA recognition motif-containing protein